MCGLGRIQKRADGHKILINEERAIGSLPDRPGLAPFYPDVHRPCDPGVELPEVRKQTKAQYTPGAMNQEPGTNPESRIPNPESRIPNPGSRIYGANNTPGANFHSGSSARLTARI